MIKNNKIKTKDIVITSDACKACMYYIMHDTEPFRQDMSDEKDKLLNYYNQISDPKIQKLIILLIKTLSMRFKP